MTVEAADGTIIKYSMRLAGLRIAGFRARGKASCMRRKSMQTAQAKTFEKGEWILMKTLKITAAQTALLMAVFTMGSKLVGFLREMVLANYYGAGVITDAYVMAQSIPVMIFGSLFSAVAISYMPIFSKKYELEGRQEANLFTSRVLNILVLISALSALLGFLCPDLLVRFFAREFSAEQAALTETYLRVTMCILMFSSICTLLEAFLQYRGVFLPQIVLGYVQSLSIIVVTVVSAYTSHYYLAAGVLLGYMLRSVGMVVLTKKQGFQYSFDWKLSEATRNIVLLAVPVFIGGSINQINAFVDKSLASGLAKGTVAALNYANLISSMILTVTATVLVTLVYPKLTQANALQDHERMNRIMEMGMNLVFIIAAPCTLGAMVYSGPVIQAVYERGAFDTASTALTEPAFFWYAAGILFQALALLLTKLYYSMGNTKTPVYYAAASVTINIALNLALVESMQQGGLALATSIAAGVNTALLYIGLRRRYPQLVLLRSKRKTVAILAATLLSVEISRLCYDCVAAQGLPSLVCLMLAIGVAALAYLLLLYLAKVDELHLIRDLIKRG